MMNTGILVIFLIHLDEVYPAESKFICTPCTCTVTGAFIFVDCEEKKLRVVPDLCNENVTEFSLARNNLTRIRSHAFVNCKNLVKLNLRDSGIRILDEHAFVGLFSLRFLDLEQNLLGSALQQLKKSDVFKDLTGLEWLDISSNRYLGIKKYSVLISLMSSLPKSRLKYLELSSVSSDCEFSDGEITPAFLESMRSESLTKLYLIDNRIRVIHGRLAKFSPNLEDLVIKRNRLLSFVFLLDLKRLKYLDISDQSLKGRNEQVVSELYSHSLLSCTFLPIKRIQNRPHIFVNDTETTKTDGIIQGQNSHNTTYFIPLPTNLSYLLALSLAYFPSWPPGDTVYILNGGHVGKVSINIPNNSIRSLTFIGVIELQHPSIGISIDLSHNQLCNISKRCFGKNFAAAIVSINLANNDLGAMVAQSDYPLQHFSNLKILDLSSNNIYYISPKYFNKRNFLNLKSFILKNNFLLDIPAQIILDTLTILNLSNNRIVNLKENVVSQLSSSIIAAEKKGNSFTLDLSDNPLGCSCDSLYFLKFICKNQRNLTGIERMSCDLNGKQVSFSKLHSNILPHLDKSCLSLQWLYVTASCLVILVICVSLSVITYRHRWDIKYFCLRLKIRRELYAELLEENGAFPYDAFVAYSERNLPWVDNHLVANLEGGETPFRLCFHHRDFEIGWPIEENILRSISTSRKTIIVLSRHFVRSGWCKFEMHMARIHMIERGVNKLIVILLEEIPTTDMPRTLVAIMRRHTYLEWPGEDMIDKVPVFWSRLRSALTQGQ